MNLSLKTGPPPPPHPPSLSILVKNERTPSVRTTFRNCFTQRQDQNTQDLSMKGHRQSRLVHERTPSVRPTFRNYFSQRTRSKHTRLVRESSDQHSGTVSIKGQDQNTQDLSVKGHRQSEQHSGTVSLFHSKARPKHTRLVHERTSSVRPTFSNCFKGQDQNTQDLSLKRTSSQSDQHSGTVSIKGQDQNTQDLSVKGHRQSDQNSGTVSIKGQDQMSLELSQYSKPGSLIF